MQLRRLGARGVNLYAQRELSEEAQRARRRGGAAPLPRRRHPGPRAAAAERRRQPVPAVAAEAVGRSVVERIVGGFEIDRERDSTLAVPAPEPRPGLEATFAPSEIAVRLNLASAERAAELRAVRKEADAAAPTIGDGPAPLVAAPPAHRGQPTALLHGDLGPRRAATDSSPRRQSTGRSREGAGEGLAREPGGGRAGRAVHALLEWSQANELARARGGLVAAHTGLGGGRRRRRPRRGGLLAPVPGLARLELLQERIRDAGAAGPSCPS